MARAEGEAEEVVAQWLSYARLMARSFPKAENADLGGVAACFLNVHWPVMNLCLVHTPVEDEKDLARRIRAAVDYAGGRAFSFATCEELLPERVRGSVQEIVERHGLVQSSIGTGMIAEAIAPPSRAPRQLEYRAVGDAGTRDDVAGLNALVYRLPPGWTREVLAPEGVFDSSVFGMAGYIDGRAVSCAMTCLVDGCLHVAWVATHPDHQGRGYGEAVTRESLKRAAAASGIQRSVLRATAAGQVLYERLGYRQVAVFRYFRKAPVLTPY